MSSWLATYRDEINDRNPTREEVVLVASNREAALEKVRKLAGYSGGVVEVVPIEDDDDLMSVVTPKIKKQGLLDRLKKLIP